VPAADDITLVAAFVVGLLGSTHCAGMCGGIVGALTLGLPAPLRTGPRQLLPYLIAYNTGRIASYSAAGALAGYAGAQLDRLVLSQVQVVGHYVAGVFLVALGLYLAGWWLGLVWLERGGALLWHRLEPLGRRLLPVRHPAQAVGLGLVWGWLPCGLVYAALAWALTVADPARGAALMFAFGLGTLPMLLLLGGAAASANRWLRHPALRRIAGAAIIAFGLYTLFGGGHAGHSGHGNHAGATASGVHSHH
jgi:sulfite exporter TauE/SafE